MKLRDTNLVTVSKTPLSLFPIPVEIFNFNNHYHDLNVSLIEDIIKEKNNDPSGANHSNMWGWHSKTNLERVYESFTRLKDIIESCGNEYCKQYGYKDGLVCSDLWANVNGPNDLNFNHHHGTSALAGVYYPVESILDCGCIFNYTNNNPLKGGTWNNVDGGSLVFQDPSYGKKIHLIKDKDSPYNVDFYHLYPTSGVLVLFPTYLLHSVLPFRDDKTRVSISFAFIYG